MILKTDRDAGYRYLTVTWNPDDPDAAAEAFREHGVSDADHVDPEIYKAVRKTYLDLIEDQDDE